MKETHYDILGVDTSFTRDLLRAAYHSRLFKSHPDKNVTSPTNSTDNIGNVSENSNINQKNVSSPLAALASVDELKTAYAVLSDPVKRAIYDEELAEKYAKNGFNITGAGLDEYTLNDFEYREPTGEPTWSKDCPRCTSENAMILKEDDLEEGSPDGTGGFQIAVSCQICSLWIRVSYEEEGVE